MRKESGGESEFKEGESLKKEKLKNWENESLENESLESEKVETSRAAKRAPACALCLRRNHRLWTWSGEYQRPVLL